jgi:long-chain acyl-CoA synthetase
VGLAANLTDSAARFPDRTALRFGDAELSYRAVDASSARLAALLRERGVEPGDRVGVMLPNVPEFVIAYYGALRAGAIVVPFNVLLKEREVAYFAGDAQVKLLLAWHACAEAAETGARGAGTECLFVTPGEFKRLLAGFERKQQPVDRNAEDTAVIFYTSGTTGQPKGAELTHDNLLRNAAAVAELYPLSEVDVTLGGLPLFHSFGQTASLNATLNAGGCLTLIQRFEPGLAMRTIERDGVTVFQGVPTMFSALLNHPERQSFDLSSLRICVSGGAAIPVEVLRSFERATGCKVLEGYGLSETSPVASTNYPDRERKPGSIGTPLPGVEMNVVDDEGRELAPGEVGEIVIRGYNVMKGYWNRPEVTAEAIRDGWFHSGDLARVDEDGYFFIVDRKKDMIIRGGYNVYPREIEEVLYEHPAVREAAVIGVPHPELGEEVAAAVVLHDGSSPDPDELRDFVSNRVAAYKYPRRIWFVDDLPVGPTGKILKRKIKLPTDQLSSASRSANGPS